MSGEGEPPSDEAARVQAVYRRYATDSRKQRAWRGDNPGNIALRRELVVAVHGLLRGSAEEAVRWLDVGCGTGWFLEALAGESRRLAGADIQADRVTACRRRVPDAEIRQADARSLPWADGVFGVVTMLNLLSSLRDEAAQRAALSEAARVLSLDGVLVIWEPRRRNPRNRDVCFVRPELLVEDAGPRLAQTTITLLPPLARRLGRAAPRLYPALAVVPVLRTHHLSAFGKGSR